MYRPTEYGDRCVFDAGYDLWLALAGPGAAMHHHMAQRCFPSGTLWRPRGGIRGRAVISAGGATWRDGRKLWLADDPAQDRWSRPRGLPEPVGYAVAAGDAGALYLLGGADGTVTLGHCWRVRVAMEGVTADRLPDLPEPRVFAAGARVGRGLYVVGGLSDANNLGTARASLLALDLYRLQDGWRTPAPLPVAPCATHAAAAAGDALLIFGGWHLDDKGVVRNLPAAHRLDPCAATWERLPAMPAANRALSQPWA